MTPTDISKAGVPGEQSIKKIEADDPDARSADIVKENIDKLKELFPDLLTEGPDAASVNVDVLKQLVGDATTSDYDEKYGLNWHGKRRARQIALTPSTGTLLPCPEDSVDWNSTQNLMIEGDNLEVLKLLQKSYAGKVKLIYIDPPYNTGKDFIYPDKFQDSIGHYLELTGQAEGGARITSNTEASGRFHTDWLNMMFPRLKLASTLLCSDGLIFISIDDCEISRLLNITDEIFGEEYFVATFVWEKRVNRENRKVVSTRHDYVICYTKDSANATHAIGLLPMTDEARNRYQNPDNDTRGPWTSVPAIAQAGHGTKAQFYELTTPSGRKLRPPSGSCWRYTESRMAKAISDRRIWFGNDGGGVPRIKKFLSEGRQGLTPESIWFAKEVGTNDSAKRELTALFDGKAVFDTPKPVGLVRRMLSLVEDADATVLDFFAGSGVTAEAVMNANVEDGGTRRFIVVQLPERCPAESEAAAYGLKTVADICSERIRRVGLQLSNKLGASKNDIGFRLFKLDSSNIRAWWSNRDDLDKTVIEQQEHLKPERTESDILYELLLKLGLDLCVPIETKTIEGKAVNSVGGGVLIACLAEEISEDHVEALGQGIAGWYKALAPAGDCTCLFRDSAFADDVAKTNLAAILNQSGIENVRSI